MTTRLRNIRNDVEARRAHVVRFAHDCTEHTPQRYEGCVSPQDLYRRYREWLASSDELVRPLGSTTLISDLEYFLDWQRVRTAGVGHETRWRGRRLRSSAARRLETVVERLRAAVNDARDLYDDPADEPVGQTVRLVAAVDELLQELDEQRLVPGSSDLSQEA